MIDAPSRMSADREPALRPYKCTGWNRRTRQPCTATVIDAYAPAGAIIKRKCNDCGTRQVVHVRPESPGTPPIGERD